MQFKFLALALFAAVGANAAAVAEPVAEPVAEAAELDKRLLVCPNGKKAFCCKTDLLGTGIIANSCSRGGFPMTVNQFTRRCALTGTDAKPMCCAIGLKGVTVDCAAP